MEPIPKKYKANKSTRTHVTKEHNNEDTTNKIEEPWTTKKKKVISHKWASKWGAPNTGCDVWKDIYTYVRASPPVLSMWL